MNGSPVYQSIFEWERRLYNGGAERDEKDRAAFEKATRLFDAFLLKQPDKDWIRRADFFIKNWVDKTERALALMQIRLAHAEANGVEPGWMRDMLDGALRECEAVHWSTLICSDTDSATGPLSKEIHMDFSRWQALDPRNEPAFRQWAEMWWMLYASARGVGRG